MSFTLRPAVRENTPLIVGLAGPSKSGKTYSAHRLAQGMVPGGNIVMLNAEGARGHQYADKFKYTACDIAAPFTYARYTEAILDISKAKPDCIIIDSASHSHDGPGGMLEQHEHELDRMAGNDRAKRDRMNWTAWIRPKAEENEFIYTMLSMNCPIVLCFRAKEKLRIVRGKEPVDLGWQPIASDRIAFETIFTLTLPPHCKGLPDLSISDMREPFDQMVPTDRPIDEQLGRKLAAWASGAKPPAAPAGESAPASGSSPHGQEPSGAADFITADQAIELSDLCAESRTNQAAALGKLGIKGFAHLPAGKYAAVRDGFKKKISERSAA